MTVSEVAAYLQLAERTVVRMAQRGEIPAAKIASQWRFLRSVVRDWLAGRMQTMVPEAAELVEADRPLLPLHEVIRVELSNPCVTPAPKEGILRQLMTPLRETGFAREPERLLAGLLERERMMSTAVGHRIAIPHPRRPVPGMFPEPAVALGVCPDGTDFDAVDDQRVHVFFLICSTREEIHLQLMAKIGWLARDQRLMHDIERIRSRRDVQAFIRRAAGVLECDAAEQRVAKGQR
ncbi:MAG: PTS sugar transporter subunit IIA [Phycisphaerae bacterium]|nr:PTS sugar transporter subunit IIA [Phycisphaerae bacterium]